MAQVSSLSFVVLLITALTISVSVTGSGLRPDDRSYEVGENIPLFANMLQPRLSQCAVSPYFSLPFCPPGNEIPNRKKSLDEVLSSDCFINTQYELRFKEEKIGEVLCKKNLTKDEVIKFRNAIIGKYEYQMCFNNILMWGSVGKVKDTFHDIDEGPPYIRTNYYLVKHIEFDAYYIKNQVKDIYLRTDFDSAVSITEDIGIHVNFTYSVFWKDWYELPAELADDSLLELSSVLDYRWPTEQYIPFDPMPFSLYVTIIGTWASLLCLVIVPYLGGYFTRNLNGEVKEARQLDNVEEGRVHLGARKIHDASCRCPPYSSLLGAVLGVGTQQLILICTILMVAHVRDREQVHPCNLEGNLEPLVLYLTMFCITSLVSGYMATSFHSHYNATGWKECVFQTGVLYFVPTFLTLVGINMLRQKITGSSHLPFLRSVALISYPYGLGTILLVSLGGKFGYGFGPIPQPPCATSRIPRLVPELSWYTRKPVQLFLGGLIPFVTILGDMDSIYASLHFKKVCGVFSTLSKAFIQICVTWGINCHFHVPLWHLLLCQSNARGSRNYIHGTGSQCLHILLLLPGIWNYRLLGFIACLSPHVRAFFEERMIDMGFDLSRVPHCEFAHMLLN